MKDNGVLTFVESDAKTLQRSAAEPSRSEQMFTKSRFEIYEPHILHSTIAIKISQEDRFELRLASR